MSLFLPRWSLLSQSHSSTSTPAPAPADANDGPECPDFRDATAGSPSAPASQEMSTAHLPSSSVTAAVALGVQAITPDQSTRAGQVDTINNLLVLQLEASTKIEGKLDSAQAAVTEVKTRAEETQSDVAGVRDRVKVIEDEVKAMRADLHGFQEEFRTFRDRLIATLDGLKRQPAGAPAPAAQTINGHVVSATVTLPREVFRDLATPASDNNDDIPAFEVDDYSQYLQDQDQDMDEDGEEGEVASVIAVEVPQAEKTFWQVRNGLAGVDPNMLRTPAAARPRAKSNTANPDSQEQHVSAIAQHAVDMQDAHWHSTNDDEHHRQRQPVASTSTAPAARATSPQTPPQRRVSISPLVDTTANNNTPGSGRSQRTSASAKRKAYTGHPLDAVPGLLFKRARSRGKSSPVKDVTPKKEPSGSGKGKSKGKGKQQAKTKSKTKGKTKTNKERQRAFNGRLAMTARPLNASDGIERGDGVWPEKGENTVKGNMQEIACDVCNGLVHWACAGFEDNTIAPEEWVCPDCQVKVKRGKYFVSYSVSASQIPRGPQDRCMRWSCIKREKKKIILNEGDQDEYYVEKFIGRRAIGRTDDRSKQRVFEYLVKWLGYTFDVSTWEHETNFPSIGQYLDQFLAECEDHALDPRSRIVLFPEALKYLDAEGNNLADESAEDNDDDDDSDDVVEILEFPPPPRASSTTQTPKGKGTAAASTSRAVTVATSSYKKAAVTVVLPPEEKIDDDGDDDSDSVDSD